MIIITAFILNQSCNKIKRLADANSDSYEKNENDCSNDDGDDSIEGSTNEVNAPIATKRAITITSFFSVNKRLSPNPNIRISDKKI